MSRLKLDRIGEQFKTNEGYIITIIDYKNANNVTIQFQDERKTILKDREYRHCRNGDIKNPYHPNEYGGFIGVGEYKAYIDKKVTKCYLKWMNMLKRLHNDNMTYRDSSYKEVVLCKEWYNFQNFAEWYYNNYYEIDGEIMHLDKDILYKGNKEYAPDKCMFVPEYINMLFIKQENKRGNLPIGVCYNKQCNKYLATCRISNSQKYLGLYNTPEEAFKVYKEFKEAYIKEVADEYRNRIPKELYDAMYRWVVEISD